ncbi:MAG: hypothetical protein WCV85_03015 [Patescibacteria group bacterium]|jgi:hypothetical protein
MNDTLTNWVKTAKQAGMSEVNIITQLKGQGWRLNDIQPVLQTVADGERVATKELVTFSLPPEPFLGYWVGAGTLFIGMLIVTGIGLQFVPSDQDAPLSDVFVSWSGLAIIFLLFLAPALFYVVHFLVPWFQSARYHRTLTFSQTGVSMQFHGGRKDTYIPWEKVDHYSVITPKALDSLVKKINHSLGTVDIHLHQKSAKKSVFAGAGGTTFFGDDLKYVLEIPAEKQKDVKTFMSAKNISLEM